MNAKLFFIFFGVVSILSARALGEQDLSTKFQTSVRYQEQVNYNKSLRRALWLKGLDGNAFDFSQSQVVRGGKEKVRMHPRYWPMVKSGDDYVTRHFEKIAVYVRSESLGKICSISNTIELEKSRMSAGDHERYILSSMTYNNNQGLSDVRCTALPD